MHELVSQLDELGRRTEIMEVIRDRWESPNSTWRNIYKALVLYEYLIMHGSEDFVQSARAASTDLLTLQRLSHYDHTDFLGQDRGINVQAKAATVITLLQDESNLRKAREEAATKRAHMQLRSRNATRQKSSAEILKEQANSHHPALLTENDDVTTRECIAKNILSPQGGQKQYENEGDEFEEFQSANTNSQMERDTTGASPSDERGRTPELLIDL